MKHHGAIARISRLLQPPIRVNAFEPWGRALEDHFRRGRSRRFYVHDSNGSCMEHSTAEAFSVTSRLKAIDEKALGLCRGRVLDVGAGAGRDALKLKTMGLDVLAIDVEPRCVEIMHARGLATARCIDIHNLHESNFDTILAMQMTIGFAGTLDGLINLLKHLALIIRADGQIVLDSMSPAYLAGSPHYPGQRQIEIHYDRYVGTMLPWLYVDYDVLRTCARQASLETELIIRGPLQHDFLARVFKATND
jgi:SAM-dependent methyltransferase